MDEVNKEIGSNYFIPANSEEEVYNNIKDMSVSHVKNQLIEEYQNQNNTPSTSQIDSPMKKE
ncbi:hypothetical protein PU629_00120 [Pullulanibacillus sp. KACC 23026]|uniref:hypothetical protein n=1 Tax=Pullulanibacillus sp. KACC 23026 TaxID=3028315 RepID=UPI0023B184FB|nr:hypothetical protein [Pullulanibacillus sp. KACC 23026]WEG12802.1 hypothetical protein PU629_00120 [Pullulanibacillus sp. KACC 23026]